MAFLDMYRTAKRGLATLSLVGVLGAALPARADLIAHSAPRANGAYEALWVSDVKVANPDKAGVTMTITGTPRGQEYSPTDASITRVITPNTTLLLEDIYASLHGAGATGVDRLLITFKDGSGNPVANLPVSHRVYNFGGPGKEFGTTMPTFDPATGYFPAGTLLGGFVGKSGERTGILVNTGKDGATIEWEYATSGGLDNTKKTLTYGKDGLYQHNGGLDEILGFPSAPDGPIKARIIAGSARILTTLNNNTTNDPSAQELTPWPETTSAYDITVQIYVMDNGTPRVFSTTQPSEAVVKRVWQVHNLDALVGEHVYACTDPAGAAVDTLPEVITNYNGLTAAEQQEFSGDRIRLEPFVNDSDNNGLPCDEAEPDHQFVYRLEFNLAKR
ncbi:TPA: hypothetical protein HA251_05595 [Candidatus Woesearchaeota archaeon]|nr:hypothetical protein [Candidatus Woesearchaeota archaeon]